MSTALRMARPDEHLVSQIYLDFVPLRCLNVKLSLPTLEQWSTVLLGVLRRSLRHQMQSLLEAVAAPVAEQSCPPVQTLGDLW